MKWLLVLVACTVWATDPPGPDEAKTLGKPLPAISLIEDGGQALPLESLKGKPLILNPLFISCPHTCSPILQSLKKSVKQLRAEGLDFNVLTFTFDPRDDDAALARIRQKLNLPPEWKIARGTPDQIDTLFKALDFRTTDLGKGVYGHPNLVAVADGGLLLRKYVYGTELYPDEMRLALKEAAQPPPKTLLQSISRPWLGVLTILAAGMGFWLSKLYRRSSRARSK